MGGGGLSFSFPALKGKKLGVGELGSLSQPHHFPQEWEVELTADEQVPQHHSGGHCAPGFCGNGAAEGRANEPRKQLPTGFTTEQMSLSETQFLPLGNPLG